MLTKKTFNFRKNFIGVILLGLALVIIMISYPNNMIKDQITIKSLGYSNEKSNSQEVWITGVNVDGVNQDLSKFAGGGWQYFDGKLFTNDLNQVNLFSDIKFYNKVIIKVISMIGVERLS